MFGNPTFKAHPTKYNGVQFRSRLEARWAAFFDLVKWKWEYEPPDEEGWIPDFLILGRIFTVSVEVKPIEWSDEQRAFEHVRTSPDLEKLRRSTRGHKLVLGAYPPKFLCSGEPVLGMLWHGYEFNCFEPAVFCEGGEKILFDFHEGYSPYNYFATGNGYCEGEYQNCGRPEHLEALWREAGNKVQWKSPAR